MIIGIKSERVFMTEKITKIDIGLNSRQNNNQDTREKRLTSILDTAEHVFIEKGYDSSTVNDILIATNLSKGGFYHYFKSKTELLDALRNRYTYSFIKSLETQVAAIDDHDMEKKFQVWVYTYVEVYRSTYTVHDLVYHSVHTSRANEDRLAIIKTLESLLTQGITKKAWKISSPQLIATIIYSAIHGVSDDTIERQPDDFPKIAKELHQSLRLLLQ